MLLEPVRNPSEWAAAQSLLRTTYAARREELPRLPVRFRWFTRRVLLPVYVGGSKEQYVALYEPDAAAGVAPLVVFAVEPGTFTTRAGEAWGEVVGELAPNGALALEVIDDEDDEVWAIWPIGQPRAAMRGAPRS